MLEVAETNLGMAKNIRFQVANGIELPFEDNSFDVVICQFGVMFFPDIVRGYREAVRVLKPGGQFIFNVWDVLEKNIFSSAVHEAVITSYSIHYTKLYECMSTRWPPDPA